MLWHEVSLLNSAFWLLELFKRECAVFFSPLYQRGCCSELTIFTQDLSNENQGGMFCILAMQSRKVCGKTLGQGEFALPKLSLLYMGNLQVGLAHCLLNLIMTPISSVWLKYQILNFSSYWQNNKSKKNKTNNLYWPNGTSLTQNYNLWLSDSEQNFGLQAEKAKRIRIQHMQRTQ